MAEQKTKTDKTDELLRLKQRAENARQEASRAAGACDEVLKRLREEAGVKSLAEARKLLKQLEKDEAAAESKFEAALAAFKKEFGNDLD